MASLIKIAISDPEYPAVFDASSLTSISDNFMPAFLADILIK